MTESQELGHKVEELSEKVEALTKDVRALLDLWEQAKGVVTFMRWTAYCTSAVGGFFLFVKPYITMKV
jgi:outer membrane murein-binding lipoprotein Lpp